MNEIIKKAFLNENTFLLEIRNPLIASHALPGQFVIVKTDEFAERIPLTIADYNVNESTVTIVVQIVGASSLKLSMLNVGDTITDFVGPLGNPCEFIYENLNDLKNKKILFIAGGVGVAPVYPQLKWLSNNGINADAIIGFRTADLVIMENEVRNVCKDLYITTEDGLSKYKGRVTDTLNYIVNEKGNNYDLVITIGPMIMMKFVCMATKKLQIKTIVSMNPIMVDGTGMCGACRLTVGGELKFACVDGPEFDGHKVNFDECINRLEIYKTEEGREYLKQKEGSTHHGGCGMCGGKK